MVTKYHLRLFLVTANVSTFHPSIIFIESFLEVFFSSGKEHVWKQIHKVGIIYKVGKKPCMQSTQMLCWKYFWIFLISKLLISHNNLKIIYFGPKWKQIIFPRLHKTPHALMLYHSGYNAYSKATLATQGQKGKNQKFVMLLNIFIFLRISTFVLRDHS